MGGRQGPRGPNTHCGRWVVSDTDKHGVRRLTCTLPRYHSGLMHEHKYTGWMWAALKPWPALQAVAARRSGEIVRHWTCRTCGHNWVGTEDAARVRGWKIPAGTFGKGDQLCRTCGGPDPETLRHVREIERSLGR